MRRAAAVLASFLLSVAALSWPEIVEACKPSGPLSVAVAPASEVRIVVGGTSKAQATVQTLVECEVDSGDWTPESTLSAGGQIRFDVRLVDDDTPTSPDDVIGTAEVNKAVKRQLRTFNLRVEQLVTHTVRCNDALEIVGEEASGEGKGPGDPADLTHELDHGRTRVTANIKAANRKSATLPAYCVAVEEEVSSLLGPARGAFRAGAEALAVCPPQAALGAEGGVGQTTACGGPAGPPLSSLKRASKKKATKHRRTRGDQSHRPFAKGQDVTTLEATFTPSTTQEAARAATRGGLPSPAQAVAGTIRITGDQTWIPVQGPMTDEGAFVATGTGTVAGFPNVSVRFEGKAHLGRLSGAWTMGVGGELPGGQPIIYDLAADAPDWQPLLDALSAPLMAAAEAFASVNQEAKVGGIEMSGPASTIAGALLEVRQALLSDFLEGDFELPDREPADPAAAALLRVRDTLSAWARQAATSRRPDRAVLQQRLDAAAAAFADSATARNAYFAAASPPLDTAPDLLAAWLASLHRAGAMLAPVGEALLGGPFTTVSAASFRGPVVAPGQIVSGFGANMTAQSASATATPLPTTLAGLSVRITDSADADHDAGLFFGAGGQVNYYIPPGVAQGVASAMVIRDGAVVAAGSLVVGNVAPSLFTANANGQGVAAAVALRIAADGSQTSALVFQQSGGGFAPAPIDLGAETDQTILLLFGTGLRRAQRVEARIGGQPAEVLGFAASPEFVGLDQVNVRLARALAGRGTVDVQVVADGSAANVATIAVR